MSVTAGQAAPDFSLAANGNRRINLSQLKGRLVVLYFYPKDDTPGCTSEAAQFRDLYAEFQALGAEVLGVSTDSVASHEKFASKLGLPFPLLADPEQVVVNAYGVFKEKSMYGKKYMGVERTTFLIDREGQILKVYPKVKVPGHAATVLKDIQAF